MTTATSNEKKFDFQLDEFYLDLQEEGRRISILSTEDVVRRPFPGLRPFKTSEFQLFKGRSGQAEELLNRLQNNRFLAVIGSSGTGKSSLVRAGLIPQLFGGYLHGAGYRWNIAICRPGKNPVANLAIALSSVKGESKDKSLLYENFDRIEPMLNRSMYGLLDVNTELNKGKTKDEQSNLLVIVDQFEELFRYDRKDLGYGNIENYFVDLLLKAAANRTSPVYVIITMRSEFLGDCVKHRGLPEAINQGQYLVPGLNRTQLKEVIEGPINLAGKEISPGLTELLINEIDEGRVKENLDQLPILQHALMRTYQEAAKQGSHEVDYEHYASVGEMEKALANHAKAKFDELQDGEANGNIFSKKQKIAKLVFQALTDASTDLKGGRRPTELKNIYAIAGAVQATQEEVNAVVDHFRDSETSFIMPPINTALHEDLMLDISHESLMRNWDLLKLWVDEETRNGKMYRKLDERREDKDDWMPASLLQELIDWRKSCLHNAAWASRYHHVASAVNNPSVHEGIYTANLAFLRRCEEASLAELEAEKQRLKDEERQRQDREVQQQREKNRKRLIWVLTTAVVLAISLSAWAVLERNSAKAQKSEAEAQRQIALKQKEEATRLADTLRVKTSQADSLRRDAEQKEARATNLASQLTEQTKLLEASRKSATEKAQEADKLRQQAVKQREEFAKQVVKNYLVEEPFYQSKYLDLQTKEQVSHALFREPFKSTPAIDTFRYIKKNSLDDVNKAAAIRDEMENDPVIVMQDAAELWQESKDRPVEEILLSFFEKNLIYKGKVEPFVYLMDTYQEPIVGLSLHGNGQFQFAAGNQIVSGRTANNSLSINDVSWASAKQNAILGSDSIRRAGFRREFTSIVATTAPDEQTTVALLSDGRVIRKKGHLQQLIGKIPKISSFLLTKFSGDGNFLATSDNKTLRLWNLLKNDSGGTLVADTLLKSDQCKNLRQICFSPNNRTLLAVYNESKMADVLHFGNKRRNIRLSRSRPIAGSFTTRGEIITMSNNGYAVLHDSLGKEKGYQQLFSSTQEAHDYANHITEISMSADRKKLLVNAEGDLILFRSKHGDSLFSPRSKSIPVQKKRLYAPENGAIVEAGFLGTETVIGLLDEGGICHWDVDETFATFSDALRKTSFLLEPSYADIEEDNIDAFDIAYSGSEPQLLREAANHYFDLSTSGSQIDSTKSEYIQKAKMLYSKLNQLDNGFLQVIDTLRLLALEKPEQGVLDTLYEIEQLRAAIDEDARVVLEKEDEINELHNSMSSNYWELSWYLLFRNDYDGVIEAATIGLSLDKNNTGIYTNLALGYLLKGEFAKAETIYKKLKDSTYTSDSEKPFHDAFLQDFVIMENSGIISPDKPAVYNEMLRIKKEILGVKD